MKLKRFVCLALIALLLSGCAAPAATPDAEAVRKAGYDEGYAVGYADGVASVTPAPTSIPDAPESHKPETPAPLESDLGTRKNPAALGDTITVETYDAILEITILSVVRGEESRAIAKKANPHNEYLDDEDLLIVQVHIANVKDLTSNDEPEYISAALFDYADETYAATFSMATVAGHDGIDIAKLYEGSEATLNLFYSGKFNQSADYLVCEDTAWFKIS